jgi:hypothetical protein
MAHRTEEWDRFSDKSMRKPKASGRKVGTGFRTNPMRKPKASDRRVGPVFGQIQKQERRFRVQFKAAALAEAEDAAEVTPAARPQCSCT